MVNLSMREAVKFYNVSRPTLAKSLKSGVISGVKDSRGHWLIDVAEMERVYQARKTDADKVVNQDPVNFTTFDRPLHDELKALEVRLAEAEKRAAIAEALAEERSRHLEDLRRMLPSPEQARKRRWWQRG